MALVSQALEPNSSHPKRGGLSQFFFVTIVLRPDRIINCVKLARVS